MALSASVKILAMAFVFFLEMLFHMGTVFGNEGRVATEAGFSPFWLTGQFLLVGIYMWLAWNLRCTTRTSRLILWAYAFCVFVLGGCGVVMAVFFSGVFWGGLDARCVVLAFCLATLLIGTMRCLANLQKGRSEKVVAQNAASGPFCNE